MRAGDVVAIYRLGCLGSRRKSREGYRPVGSRRWLGLVVLGVAGLSLAGCGSTGPDGSCSGGPSAGQPSAEATPPGIRLPEKPPTTGRGVLEAMAAAYQSAGRYADAGQLHLYVQQGQQVLDQKVDFAVSFQRPNRLRLEVYQVKLVCDGQRFRAAIEDLPGQVLDLPAPEQLSVKDLVRDPILAEVLIGGIAAAPPQPLLLLEKNALEQILQQAAEPELVEPGNIGPHECYRVVLRRPEGQQIFWVDKKEYLLRRIEYPTELLAPQISPTGKPDQIALVAEFHSATFHPPEDPKAFMFEVPKEAKLVKYFVPPDPRLLPDPAQLLNKQAPDFQFTDLSGKPVRRKDLTGKVVYLDFWGPQCAPCRQMLPLVEKVYQKYKDHPEVVFLAVSVAPPSMDNKELEKIFGELNVTVPMVRDLEGHGSQMFRIQAIPTTFLIGKDGRIQDYQLGLHPNLESELSAKIEKLLAGQDIYQTALAQFEQRVQQYEAALQRAMEGKPPEEASRFEQELPKAEIRPRSEPSAFRLQPLWKWQEPGASPGNLLVVEGAGGSARIFLVDQFKKVRELSPDGKLINTYSLDLQPQEVVTFLITGRAADGTDLFAALAVQQQRLHVFDQQFQPLFHFPADALQHPHAGIYDAAFADLNADGQLELYVSYWDVVGVQQVDLAKKNRRWTFRQISNVARLAVAPADPHGKPLLWCTHDRGSLVGLDYDGQRRAELLLPNRPLYAAFAADLTGDGQPEWCGMHIRSVGQVVMVGFNLAGKELWTYELPKGMPEHPIEPVSVGRLLPDTPACWIFPGADGSIHFVGPDGHRVEMFYYGESLCGLAVANLQAQPVLLVSTPKSVEAWQIQPR